jgi:pilus assembly protein Flp/PilA
MNLVPYFKNVIAPYIRAIAGRSERGAALVEYALLVALIAVVCIAAIGLLGENADSKFSEVATEIGNAG